MASSSAKYLSLQRFFLLYIVFFLFVSLITPTFSEHREFLGARRRTLTTDEEEQPKKKPITLNKNQTKPITFNKNQTKTIKPTTNSTTKTTPIKLNKNQTKPIKPTTSSTPKTTPISKTHLNTTSHTSNLTKRNSILTKKSSDPPKNKTIKAHEDTKPKPHDQPDHATWFAHEELDDEDLITEFRDLPYKFHDTLLPDLQKISTTSKAYINKANQEIIQGFKPLVGKQYAAAIASITSCIFILVPLLLVYFLFSNIRPYFSLQKVLIFIQIYLSIYFAVLALCSLVTGIEPLKFFYYASLSSYLYMQILQTLGFVLYLVLLLLYLVVVFSTESGLGPKMLGLGQTLVGLAIGFHYYVAVFHRAVLREPPKTSWKIHVIYATCFLVICVFARAEWRKKAYLQEGGEDGKKS